LCDFDGTYSPYILEIVHSDFVVIALAGIGDVWIEEVLIVSFRNISLFIEKLKFVNVKLIKFWRKKWKFFFLTRSKNRFVFILSWSKNLLLLLSRKLTVHVVSFIIRNLVNIQFSISIAMPLLYYCTYNRKLFHLVQQKWRKNKKTSECCCSSKKKFEIELYENRK
jgi:hypothetical protein